MRGTTESKWGQETDPQGRDLQALDRPDELYAAADYPTPSEAGQDLPEWAAADRKIEQTDLVLWHTVGMQHVVRGEDWLVMPVLWHSFELRPFDFFAGNPALDLPKR